jgi:hypothetical protein
MMRAAGPLTIFATLSVLAATAIVALHVMGRAQDALAPLSGQAILAVEQRALVQDILAFYPPLPLLVTLPFGFLSGFGVQPAIAAVVMLAGIWGTTLYYCFRGEAARPAVAFLIACSLALNPLLLSALVAGPGAMLLIIGVTMLGFGLFGMSGEAAAPDAIMCAVALCLIAFAHPFGLFVVLASLPGLALTAPPALLSRTPHNLFLILLFPVGFGLLSFAYVRWTLGSDAFAYIHAAIGPVQPDELAEPVRPAVLVSLALAAFAIATPVVVAFLYWGRKRAFQLWPVAALITTALLAAGLQVIARNQADVPLTLSICLPIAALCSLEAVKERPHAVLFLLLIGWVGALLLVTALPQGFTHASPRRAVASAEQDQTVILKRKLCSLKGVLVDTRAHPQLAQLCGTAQGFVSAGEADFDIQIQSRRLTSEFVLAAAPYVTSKFDLVAHTFPDLYRHGAPGYRLIYDEGGWRLYSRPASRSLS